MENAQVSESRGGDQAFQVFISHAKADALSGDSEDGNLVRSFVELIIEMGVRPENIYCSSLDDHMTPPGKKFQSHIQSELLKADLVLALISKNFHSSPYCWCEVGGVWAHSKKLIPIIIPPLRKEDALAGVMRELQAVDVDQKSQIMAMQRIIEKDFKIRPSIFNRFNDRTDKFLKEIAPIIQKMSAVETAIPGGRDPSHSRSLEKIRSFIKRNPGWTISNFDFQRALEEINFCAGMLPCEYRDVTLEAHYCNFVLDSYYKPASSASKLAARQAGKARVLDVDVSREGECFVQPDWDHHLNRLIDGVLNKLKSIQGRNDSRIINIHRAIFEFDFDIESRRFWDEHILP